MITSFTSDTGKPPAYHEKKIKALAISKGETGDGTLAYNGSARTNMPGVMRL